MNIYINHCVCSDSNWGGDYSCRVIVTIDQYETRADIYDQKSSLDWNTILEKHPYLVKQSEVVLNCYMDEVYRLKPEVIQWLKDNIKDRKLKKWEIKSGDQPQAWAVGTDDYNFKSDIDFRIFFERVTDAMKFVKRWSKIKQPKQYFNYFKNIRRELDSKTNRLKTVDEFSE